MAINKNKINDNALKFIQKGQVKKAIREYEKILAEDPNDVRTLLKKGDLLVRVGEKEHAVETYLSVASTYSQQGFHLKAVAVFKQILKIDEGRIDVNLRLAEEYQNLGIAGDAMAHLQVVAGYYDEQGMTRESLDIYQRIVDLDPENIASRIKLAELYSREQMINEAVEEFTRAAEDLKAANRIEDYIKVAERLIYHDNSNLPLIRELANIYLQRGDTKRALGKLQICFKADPRDLETLGMLALAFQELNQLSKTVSVYKEMARIYLEQGAEAEVQQVYRRILEIAPDDPEAGQAVASVPRAPPAMEMADVPVVGDSQAAEADMTLEQSVPEFEQEALTSEEGFLDELPEAMVEVEDIDAVAADDLATEAFTVDQPTVMEEPSPEPTFEPEPTLEPALEPEPAPVDAGAQPATEQSRELVSRLLTETDVYIKYGLQNKALDHLNRIFQIDPYNIEAHEKLKDLYVAADQMDHAAQELYTLAQLSSSRGRSEEARGYLRSLFTISPDHPQGRELAEQLGEAAPVSDGAFPEEAQIDLDPDAPDVMVLDEDATVEVGQLGDEPMLEPGEQAVEADDLQFEEEGSGAAIEIVEDVPIDLDDEGIDLGEVEEDEGEASTVIADREHYEQMSPDESGAIEQVDVEEPDEEDLPAPFMLDYEGTEVTAEASALQEVPGPFGQDTDLAQDESVGSLEEPEVVELVEADEVEPVEEEVLPLLEEPELIEFTGEGEAFFSEEQQQQDMTPDPPMAPPTLVSDMPPGAREEPADLDAGPAPVDDFDPSEASTMVGNEPSLLDQVPDLETGSPDEAVVSAEANVPDESEMAPGVTEEAETAEAAEEDEEELEDALEEVDFFIQQNLLDEAADELERLQEEYPGNPSVQEQVARLEGLRHGKAAAPQAPDDEPAGDFDIASEIEKEVGEDAGAGALEDDFQYSFDDVFDEFKKGVERVVAKEDSSTHFDLGIAYKEMGLVDDAISEFSIAAQDDAKKATALSMIGLCLVEKSQYSEAINRFKDALHGQGISEQEATGIYYEIGHTYELLEDVNEALFYYRKVYKRDAKFRDVASRIKALGGGGRNPPDSDGAPGSKNKISYM